MSAVEIPITFTSPPFVWSNWLGRDPHDHQPRLVHCFAPSEADEFAVVQSAILGLDPLVHGRTPRLTAVWAQVEQRCLELHTPAGVYTRTEPLADSMIAILLERSEVLLVWVDVPLANPRDELPSAGIHHVWTGLAPVRDITARTPRSAGGGLR